MFTLILLLSQSYLQQPRYNPDPKYWEMRLGSNVFREREKATKELKRFGWKGIDVLKTLEKSRDLEVALRCKRLKQGLYAEVMNSFDPYPEIDVFWYRWGKWYTSEGMAYNHYHHYVEQARPLWNDAEQNWNQLYRIATRCLFYEKLNQGCSRTELRLLWIWMHFVDHRAGYGVWDRQLRPFYPWNPGQWFSMPGLNP